jgi:tRNA (guanine37-N1)-methyltransferase
MPARPRSLKAALEASGALAKDELARVQRAFEIIGDIAVVEIPEGLEKKAGAIGRALLALYPNVKVVAKRSPFQGELRTRPLEVIAGERRLTTLHVENSVRLRVDVARVYFSPRLSSERLRVAKQVRPGENVLVLFAGAGPYSVLIAKLQPTAKVASVELNPVATPLALENVRLNKVAGRVEVIEADARAVCREPRFAGWADRIVMPLPERAGEYLADALLALKPGGTVHFYAFGADYGPSLRTIEKACAHAGRKCEVVNKRVCGTYAPRVARLVVDFRAG